MFDIILQTLYVLGFFFQHITIKYYMILGTKT